MRILLYSHDGMGLGSVRRQLAIATALTKYAPNINLLLATSVDEISRFGVPSNCEIIKLPSLPKLTVDGYLMPGSELHGREQHQILGNHLLLAGLN